MSTDHIVHEIMTPGQPGDGFNAQEAAQVRSELETYSEAVERIDPGTGGPIGASLRQSPTGPAWVRDAIDASWFSNPNDAITAAGPGGKVLFKKDTTYWLSDALLVDNGTQLIGEDRKTTIIRASGADGVVRAKTLGTAETQDVYLFNLTLNGGWQVPTVLDARDMTRGHFDRLIIEGPINHGVLFGGDSGLGGWSNSLWRSRISLGDPGAGNRAAVKFYGRIGRTGAITANNNSLISNIIFSAISPTANTSYAIDIEEGGENHFAHNDIGYNPSTAIHVGSLGQNNSFISNRTEDPLRAVLIEGGAANRFISNSFHIRIGSTEHPVYISNGADRNVFAWNNFVGGGIDPKIFETGSSPKTVIFQNDGNSSIPNGSTNYVNSWRSITAKTPGDAQPRYTMSGDGYQSWGDGAAAPDASMYRHSANLLSTADGTSFRMGSGRWNTGHPMIGFYHLWVDQSNRLRIKPSAPTSDTDGIIVGTQT